MALASKSANEKSEDDTRNVLLEEESIVNALVGFNAAPETRLVYLR